MHRYVYMAVKNVGRQPSLQPLEPAHHLDMLHLRTFRPCIYSNFLARSVGKHSPPPPHMPRAWNSSVSIRENHNLHDDVIEALEPKLEFKLRRWAKELAQAQCLSLRLGPANT